MPYDPIIDPIISSKIPEQFPARFQEDGPLFVAFVQDYFRWMERQGPVYFNRKIAEYRDIDRTVDDFLIYFKETYLKDIPIDAATDVRQLVKHSLDIYRAKGTERAIDTLFRLVFGSGVKIYRPGQDIFRSSSGKWVEPKYIEISLRGDHSRFIGKDIVGLYTGAKAFVERYIRRGIDGKIVDVLFLTNMKGEFKTGELINLVTNPLDVDECPTIVGSLSRLNIIDGSEGYSVGNIIDLEYKQKKRAKARVTSTANTTGQVEFNLIYGGAGYTTNAQVLVSNTILTTTINPDYREYHYNLFDQIIQPKASIAFANSSEMFATGTNVYTYHANNLQKGYGVIYSVANSSANVGTISVSVRSGNLQGNMIYTEANAISANQTSYTDETASANVIAEGENITLTVNTGGFFIPGEPIEQEGGGKGVVYNVDGNLITVTVLVGTFPNTIPAIGKISNTVADVVSSQVRVGVIEVSNTFIVNDLVPFTSSTYGGVINRISTGAGASFNVASLKYTENVTINDDVVSTYLTVPLNSNTFGLPANTSANISSVVSTSLNYENYTFGSVNTISNIAVGNNYSEPPLIRIYEPLSYIQNKKHFILSIVGGTQNFYPGEVVEQSATGAKGYVVEANSSTVYLNRMTIGSDFIETTNSTTTIISLNSGSMANVVSVAEDNEWSAVDLGSQYVGIDAIIKTEATIKNGTITGVEVVSSGFGLVNGDIVSIVGSNNGLFSVSTETYGKDVGYYKEDGGFPSSNKKLHDGHYYQDFSYEVRSEVPYEKYANMLRNILHVAGTKVFGSFYKNSIEVSLMEEEVVLVVESSGTTGNSYSLEVLGGTPNTSIT